MSGPERAIRETQAQNAAVRDYAGAHERLSLEEQQLRHAGLHGLADDCRKYAQIAARAWLADRENPEPRNLDA